MGESIFLMAVVAVTSFWFGFMVAASVFDKK